MCRQWITWIIVPGEPEPRTAKPMDDISFHRALLHAQAPPEASELLGDIGALAFERALQKAERDAVSTGATTLAGRLGSLVKKGGGVATFIAAVLDAEDLGCQPGFVSKKLRKAFDAGRAVHAESARAQRITISSTLPSRIDAARDLHNAALETSNNLKHSNSPCEPLAWEYYNISGMIGLALTAAKERAEEVILRRDAYAVAEAAWDREVSRPSPAPRQKCGEQPYYRGSRNSSWYRIYWYMPPERPQGDEKPEGHEGVKYVGQTVSLPSRCNSYNSASDPEEPKFDDPQKDAWWRAENARRVQHIQTLRLPWLNRYHANYVEEALIAHFGPWRDGRPPLAPWKSGQRRAWPHDPQLVNDDHRVSTANERTYCKALLTGQFILKLNREYDFYAHARFTDENKCPGTGKEAVRRRA